MRRFPIGSDPIRSDRPNCLVRGGGAHMGPDTFVDQRTQQIHMSLSVRIISAWEVVWAYKVGQDLSDSISNWLHVDLFRF